MAKEYVEREARLKEIDTAFKEYGQRGDILKLFSECRASILFAPTADVVEVRHGYWIESDNLESFNTRGWKRYKKVICSNCKKSNYNNHSNYCPNCGAKMDGKGEGE
jgi:uncharacterized paraquat-inducible protein A